VVAVIKMMYAESRLPGVSRLGFLRRWRQHGAFAMTQPGFWSTVVRYVHHDPLLDVTAFPGVRADYDALGEIGYASLADLHESMASDDLKVHVRGDGAHTFARSRTLRAVVEERVLREGGCGRFNVASFVSAADGASVGDVYAQVTDAQLALLAGSDEFSRCTRRIAVSPVVERTFSGDVAVFIELDYDTIEDAAAGYAIWRPACERSFDRRIRVDTIVTTRCALYDGAALGATNQKA
jgi:EthD domain